MRYNRSPQRGGPGAHAQRRGPGPALQVAGWAGPGLRSSPVGTAVAGEGGSREGRVASGAGRHTHNFSIHSPSNTSVQLEAVMGRTRLRSCGSTACSGPASASAAAAAATQATRSAVSSGPRRPPSMSRRGARLLGRVWGRGYGRPADRAFPSSARKNRAAPPPPYRADQPSSRTGWQSPPLIGPGRGGHAPSRLHSPLPGASVALATAAFPLLTAALKINR